LNCRGRSWEFSRPRGAYATKNQTIREVRRLDGNGLELLHGHLLKPRVKLELAILLLIEDLQKFQGVVMKNLLNWDFVRTGSYFVGRELVGEVDLV
jgi:hypothetical protein